MIYAVLALGIAAAAWGISYAVRRNSEKNAPPARKQTHSDHVHRM